MTIPAVSLQALGGYVELAPGGPRPVIDRGRARISEDALNRPLARLSLPARKARAIVVQHQLHGTRQHPREIIPGRLHVKERNPLEMIDFRLSAGQCAAARMPASPSR